MILVTLVVLLVVINRCMTVSLFQMSRVACENCLGGEAFHLVLHCNFYSDTTLARPPLHDARRTDYIFYVFGIEFMDCQDGQATAHTR